MRGPSVQARILTSLRAGAKTDAQLAAELSLPEPSVRRTRLHLAAAGAVVFAGSLVGGAVTWRMREPHEKPLVYSGTQVLPWR